MQRALQLLAQVSGNAAFNVSADGMVGPRTLRAVYAFVNISQMAPPPIGSAADVVRNARLLRGLVFEEIKRVERERANAPAWAPTPVADLPTPSQRRIATQQYDDRDALLTPDFETAQNIPAQAAAEARIVAPATENDIFTQDFTGAPLGADMTTGSKVAIGLTATALTAAIAYGVWHAYRG